MTMLQPFDIFIQRADQRIEQADALTQLEHVLHHVTGIAQGYYLAGAVPRVSVNAATRHMACVGAMRRAQLEFEAQAQECAA